MPPSAYDARNESSKINDVSDGLAYVQDCRSVMAQRVLDVRREIVVVFRAARVGDAQLGRCEARVGGKEAAVVKPGRCSGQVGPTTTASVATAPMAPRGAPATTSFPLRL